MRPHAVLYLLVCLAVCACDRDAGNAIVAPPPPPPRTQSVEVQALTPLPPGRRTHLAPDQFGRIYWAQESDAGFGASAGENQVVFLMTDGGLPQPTRLTSAAVLEALGQPATGKPGERSSAGGAIQSLAAAPDGRLYFYFSGGRGKLLLAALGSFDPRTGQVAIHADAAELERASGLAA